MSTLTPHPCNHTYPSEFCSGAACNHSSRMLRPRKFAGEDSGCMLRPRSYGCTLRLSKFATARVLPLAVVVVVLLLLLLLLMQLL